MSESFRPGREDDLPAIGRLVAHSFVARTAAQHEEGLREGPWGGVESHWVAEEDGVLVGFCQLLRLQQWIGRVKVPTMGLGTVSIAPTHRRRGLAARLIIAGMRHARERGDHATALYPFRASFYGKLGYGLAGVVEQYRVPPESVPDAPERLGVRLAESEADRAELETLYERWASRHTGQLQRTAGAWKRLLGADDRAAVLYRNAAGEAEGYAVVRYRGDLPPTERFLDVLEQAWLTDPARRGIHAWLGSLGDQWRLVAYRAHPDERFGDLLDEPRLPAGTEPGWNLWFPSATLLRGPMFRLLDLPAAFAARPRFGNRSLDVRLRVRDEQIPENAGDWRLSLDDGRATLDRGEVGAEATVISLGIDTLSRIFIGGVRLAEAVKRGSVEVERQKGIDALDAALRLPRPWTFDAF